MSDNSFADLSKCPICDGPCVGGPAPSPTPFLDQWEGEQANPLTEKELRELAAKEANGFMKAAYYER